MPTSSREETPSGGAAPTVPDIFISFLRIGITAFGGPAMVTHIKAMAVDTKKWLDEENFRQGIALCQMLPGAIAVNAASYAGYRAMGLPGMLAAFTGFTLPAFLLMLFLSAVYVQTRSLPVMNSLFSGLEVIVVSILFHAALTFGRKTLRDCGDLFLAAAGAALLLSGASPFPVIAGAALSGIMLHRNISAGPQHAPRRQQGTERDALLIAVFFAVCMVALRTAGARLFDLAWVMAKIEAFAFGGGYTALALMFHEVVEVRQWIDNKTLMDGLALGQITPGPILITSAFIGYMTGGFAGAAVGTVAVFAPGLFLIVATLPLFDRFRSSPFFLRAVRGTVSCFTGFLLFIALKFASAVHWDVKGAVLLASSFGGLLAGVDMLYLVIVGALASLLLM